MKIEITLSPQVLKSVRKLLQKLHLKRLLAWWRNIEKRHWATRGLVNGRSTKSGWADFIFATYPKEKHERQ